jgi:hypothetical protein
MFAASKIGFASLMAHAGNHREIVGRNIRAYRTEAGLTLEKLAESFAGQVAATRARGLASAAG